MIIRVTGFTSCLSWQGCQNTIDYIAYKWHLFIYLFNYIILFKLLFSYNFPTFFAIALPCPVPKSLLPQSIPTPLSMPMTPLFMFLDLPLPLLSPLPSLVTVSLIFICKSLVLFCSFVCFVDQLPLIGEIRWYLSCIDCLISLNIMTSSSIHAVVKGRSSFFLSAGQYSIV